MESKLRNSIKNKNQLLAQAGSNHMDLKGDHWFGFQGFQDEDGLKQTAPEASGFPGLRQHQSPITDASTKPRRSQKPSSAPKIYVIHASSAGRNAGNSAKISINNNIIPLPRTPENSCHGLHLVIINHLSGKIESTEVLST